VFDVRGRAVGFYSHKNFRSRRVTAAGDFERMLRLLLPPNLAASAPRDAIAVKVDLDLSRPPDAGLLPALAILQRLCGGTAVPPPFVQLTRAQLRELVSALKGQPAFAFVNAPQSPLLWIGPRLRGVSEHLDEAPAPKPIAAPTPRPASKLPTLNSQHSTLPFAKNFP